MARKGRESGSRRRDVLERLYAQQSPAQIQNELGLETEEFDELFREILDELASRQAGEPVEHTYAHFMIDMTAIMRKLSTLANGERTHPRDAVSALKAQADIRRDVLAKGRELGVIKPIPGEDGGRFGIDLSELAGLSNAEIRGKLYRMLKEFKSLESEMVEADFIDAPIDDIFPASVKQLPKP